MCSDTITKRQIALVALRNLLMSTIIHAVCLCWTIGVLSFPSACSMEDTTAILGPCDDTKKTRTVFHVWKYPKVCLGNEYILRDQENNVKCGTIEVGFSDTINGRKDVVCGSGSILKGTSCEICPADTFSVGGGLAWILTNFS